MTNPNPAEIPAPASDPPAAVAAAVRADGIRPGDDRPPVDGRFIVFNLVAVYGVYLALVTPIAISLAIRVEQLAPGDEQYLGYVLGIGSLAAVLVGPIVGVYSDRTRSRFGRRRPWLVGTAVLGLVGLVVVASAPDLVVLTVGWVLTQWGFGSTNVVMVSVSADRLPESQRGKLAGLGGVVTMLAPITGAALGGVLSTQTLALFLVPGVVGLVMVLAFTVFIREDSSRAMVVDETLTVGSVLAKYLFDPRRFPDFAWNWAGRFLFYIGLTFSTTFTAFFFADKLGVPVTEIGGIVAIAGLLGAVGTMGGALGSGFLSDRLRRRKIFVLTSGIVFAVGTIVMAFAPTLPVLLAGSFLCNVGIGVFAAVDQALVLDVLPERDTEAGRYNAINQFATTIPQAVAPLIAPVFLAVGATADSQNYPLLYLVAAVFTVAGGVLVLRVKGVR